MESDVLGRLTCRRVKKSLLELVVPTSEEATAPGWLYEHVRKCPSCTREYNRLVWLRRFAEGGSGSIDEPCDAETRWARDRVIRAALRERVSGSGERRAFAIRGWPMPALGAAAVAAVALVVALVPGPSEQQLPSAAEEWLARSGRRPSLRVRALCEVPTETGDAIVSVLQDGSEEPASHCSRAGYLRFAYVSDVDGHLHAVFLAPNGSVHWLAGAPDMPESARVQAQQQWTPLAAKLGCETIGTGSATALFVLAPTPLDAAALQQMALGEVHNAGQQRAKSGIAVVRRSVACGEPQ